MSRLCLSRNSHTSSSSSLQYLFYLLLFIVATLCFEVLAIALGFNFFIKNSFGAIFVLSIVWGNAMVAAAFMVSAFFESAKTATVVGYCTLAWPLSVHTLVRDTYR